MRQVRAARIPFPPFQQISRLTIFVCFGDFKQTMKDFVKVVNKFFA